MCIFKLGFEKLILIEIEFKVIRLMFENFYFKNKFTEKLI